MIPASTNYKVKLLSIGGGTMNHGKNHEDTKILEAARCLDFSELQEINGYHLIHLRSLYISQLHPSSPMFSSKIFFLNRNLICQDFFPLTFLCDISFQRSKLLSSQRNLRIFPWRALLYSIQFRSNKDLA